MPPLQWKEPHFSEILRGISPLKSETWIQPCFKMQYMCLFTGYYFHILLLLIFVNMKIKLFCSCADSKLDLYFRFSISGYPTMKFFKDGEPHDYDGPRDEDGEKNAHRGDFFSVKSISLTKWPLCDLGQNWYKSMAQCKTAVTPLLTHWSYWSLALSHWNDDTKQLPEPMLT